MTDITQIWEQLHFIRPQALWLLVPVVLFPLFYLIRSDNSDKWVKRISPHLRQYVIRKGDFRALYAARFLLVFGWVLIVLSLSGPSWKQIEKPGAKIESTSLILLQVNESMLNSDLQPTRLERAKYKIKDLLDANPGIRMGLIAYSGSAHLVIPPTIDYKTIAVHLEALQPNVMPRKGHNLSEALELADTLTSDITAPVHLLLLTDVLDEEMQFAVQSNMAGRHDKMTIMPFTAINAELKDNAALLSKEQNINVLLPALDGSDVSQLARMLEKEKEYQLDDELQESIWVEHGYYLVWAIAVLILFWFRKGFMPTLMVAALLSSCTMEHGANDLFYTPDYQGQKAFDKGNYSEAAELFEDAQHKGTAYFRAGEYKKAVKAFSADSSATGYYNMGVAFLRDSSYNQAYNAFYRAYMADSTYPGSAEAIHSIQQWFIQQNDQFEALSDTAAVALFEKMKQNQSPEEDLGGGGQEATEEQMQEERLMEEAESEVHGAEEEEDLPDEFEQDAGMDARQVMIRDVQEDPGEFLKRKFEYQLKKRSSKKK
ncbi:VWA domain-containing protein [Carboxylicivirga sediminis]|uniref:VWA domain-containing protein n=1 Tax=Carboxylicivirga sediminis TaxID=2006564 RepID=A0A941F4B1_9BACT|nr:VWA domain-containing protein [Carboxylicivirga sediminis]MBR8534965.1 VWA domain-containing protein [Carboxylicivirga sediminis]